MKTSTAKRRLKIVKQKQNCPATAAYAMQKPNRINQGKTFVLSSKKTVSNI